MDKTERIVITETPNYGIGIGHDTAPLNLVINPGKVGNGTTTPNAILKIKNNDTQEPKKDVTPANR